MAQYSEQQSPLPRNGLQFLVEHHPAVLAVNLPCPRTDHSEAQAAGGHTRRKPAGSGRIAAWLRWVLAKQ